MPAIDADLQKLLDAAPFQLTPEAGVEVARRQLRELPRPPLHPEVRSEDRIIEGPDGAIPLRIYWPPGAVDTAVDRGVVVYFHGGGWALGDLDTHDVIARQHAVGADVVVVSVAYRLAPEHPFPAGVEDSWAAVEWTARHAVELGADPRLLAVAGDSAGANLAAVMALVARDHGAPALVFQLLWYPAVVLDASLPSFTENAEAPVLDLKAIMAFIMWYAEGVDLSDPPVTLAPGRANSLAGIAPAYVAVAGHDPLRDDGIRYAELLSAAGVPVHLDVASTLVHGYLGYAGVVATPTVALHRGLSALRAALSTG